MASYFRFETKNNESSQSGSTTTAQPGPTTNITSSKYNHSIKYYNQKIYIAS